MLGKLMMLAFGLFLLYLLIAEFNPAGSKPISRIAGKVVGL